MRFFDHLSKSPLMPAEQQGRGRDKEVTRVQYVRSLLCGPLPEEGATIVEFALTFVVFIFLVFAVIDFGHLYFVEMEAQNAMQEAARYGSTGQHLPDPNHPGNYLSRVTSIINTLQNDATGLQFTNIQVSSLTGGAGSGGGPGDMLTVTATVNMPLLTPLVALWFPNGVYTFNSSITVKNEPFQPSLTK